MQQNLVCRACLAVEGKFSYIHDFSTAQAYESLIGYPLSPSDGYPQHLCSYCRRSVLKFMEFRSRCLKVLEVLQQALAQGQWISKQIPHGLTSNYPDLKPQYIRTKTITLDVTNAEPEIVLVNEPTDVTDLKIVKEEVDENDDIHMCGDDIAEIDEVTVNKHIDVTAKSIDVHFKEFSKDFKDRNEIKVKKRKNVKKSRKRGRPKTEKRINTLKTLNSNQIIIDYANSAGFDIKFLSPAEQVKEIDVKRKEIVLSGHNCERCGKHFRDVNALNRHTKAYHVWNPGSFICDICSCVFQKKLTLKCHIENHSWVFTCQKCDFKTNQQKGLMSHRSFHEGKEYPCQFCDKVYSKITTFLSHLKMLHASELPWCRLCGEFFVGEKGVEKHVRLTHDMVEEFPCVCPNCDKRFKSDAALERHTAVQGCALPNCVQCGESFPNAALLKHHLVQRHFANTTPEHHDCSQCNLRFNNTDALGRHVCGSSDVCVQCGEAFENTQLLTDHVFLTHDIFRCEECGKQFTNGGYFKRHYELSHSARPRRKRGPRPLAERQEFKKREKKDKPDDVQKREKCPKQTVVRKWRVASEGDSLIEKLVEHAAEGRGGMPLICELCGKGFPTWSRLSTHQRSHSAEPQFSCPHCNKGFKQKATLKLHVRVHTGERPYKCSQCPKAFRTYTGLDRHFLIHTGERKHVCAMCNKTFQTSTTVKTHIKTAHLHMPWPQRHNRKRKTQELALSNNLL